jgi:hypothetical protein
VNYAEYVAPLLSLMHKGIKWKWTKEMQEAFVVLRSNFAESIHLIHPDESLPFINTDANCRAIGGVLCKRTTMEKRSLYLQHREF